MVAIFDMGAENCALMAELGFHFNKTNREFSIQHPNDNTRKLYLIPDPVHWIKNITCAIRKRELIFPQWMVDKFNLSSNSAKFDDIKEVYETQNERTNEKYSSIKLAPKLTEEVMYPKHYEKMRESIAYNLISSEVSHAIDILNASNKKNATSFLLEILNRVKNIFTNDQCWTIDDIETYEKDIKFLKFLSEKFFAEVEFVMERGYVKSLNGALVACSSLIEMSRKLFHEGAKRVIPKHMLNNAVENTFSQVTQRFHKPDALQFQKALKGLSITHYVKEVRGSNYGFEGNRTEDPEFLTLLREFKQNNSSTEPKTKLKIDLELQDFANENDMFANKLQRIAFQTEVNRLIDKNREEIMRCTDCWECIKTINYENGVPTISPIAAEFFNLLELHFRLLENKIECTHSDFKNNFINNTLRLSSFSHCEIIRKKLIDDFVQLKIKIANKRRNLHKVNKFSSKSLAT